MHDTDHNDDATTAEKDANLEAAVFSELVDNFPIIFTDRELTREMWRDPDVFTEHDSIRRTVQMLINKGLARRHGPFVMPTRAALAAGAIAERF